MGWGGLRREWLFPSAGTTSTSKPRPGMCARPPRWQAGMSLIEVVVFIVVLGLALAGVMILYSQATRASADPLVRKQALAIASSLLEEIELRAFTLCDPDDPNV